MSKVMTTSGNQAPVIKGSAMGSDVASDGAAAGLFAALFGDIQQIETDSDADVVQTNSDISDSEQSNDPRLMALLESMCRAVPAQAETNSETSDETEVNSSGLDKDKLADAGLLAAHSQLSEIGHRRSGQASQQGPSIMAALAEDLKQTQTKISSTQTSQTVQANLYSDLDDDFIGPPLPQAMKKSALAWPEQSANNVTNAITNGLQTARLHTDVLQRPKLKTQAHGTEPSFDLAEQLEDTNILDVASLKAERLAELKAQIGDRPSRAVAPSVQLTASATFDAQTGLSATGQQPNSGQAGGQHSGSGSTFAGTASTGLAEQWLDVLDTQDEKWTEQLVRRIDREFRTGGKGLELEMSPRNLGHLKVSLSVAQDQTNVVLRTETGAAAQLLTEAEGRLAQMLDEAGLKLGQFDAFAGGQNQGFGQQDSRREQKSTMAEAENNAQTGDIDTTDGLVNLKA